MFKRGQPVLFKGKTYYIVDGPVISTEGHIYHISEVPPPIPALEQELKPA
jgi:hypothetical protein